MKIKEYNDMMAYLTRPGKILGNNINKTNTGRVGLAKGTKPDTKAAPKNSKILNYINDTVAMHEPETATKEQLEGLEKRLANARAYTSPEKKKMSKQDEYNTYFNKKSPMYYKNRTAKIPVVPPKPDLMNGHSDWNTDDWLESVDPGGWANEKKRAGGILEQDLANEYWQTEYEKYLNGGGTLSYQQFMQLELTKTVSQKINKIAEEKKQTEGLAALLGVGSGRTTKT